MSVDGPGRADVRPDQVTLGVLVNAVPRDEAGAGCGVRGAGMVAQDPRVHIVGPRLTPKPDAIGVGLNHPDLTRFVNGVLARAIADGSRTRFAHPTHPCLSRRVGRWARGGGNGWGRAVPGANGSSRAGPETG